MLDKADLKEMKEMAEKVRRGEAEEKDFLKMLRDNADDILDMAEKSIGLEFENERLNTKIDWVRRGLRTPDM